jgi:hypothetical protein
MLVVADKPTTGTLVELPLHCEDRPYIALRHGDRRRLIVTKPVMLSPSRRLTCR